MTRSLTNRRTIELIGARGGQGTSTVAAALAVLCAGHAPTVLVSDDTAAAAALIGIPAPLDDDLVQLTPNLVLVGATPKPEIADDTVVIDAGRCTPARRQGPALSAVSDRRTGEPVERYAVLRGPCYLALATLLTATEHFDGVILVEEPGRSLSRADVTDVLGLPVVAAVRVDPAVARTIDAGLLLSRLHRLAPYRDLHTLAARPANLTTPTSKFDTDLPLPKIGNGEATSRCRDRAREGSVGGVWNPFSIRRQRVEHRPSQPRCRRLLHR